MIEYLWLDDCREPNNDWFWVKNAKDAINALKEGVAYASFDHDLGFGGEWIYGHGWTEEPYYGDGIEVVRFLVDNEDLWPSEMLGVHTDNPVGRQNMVNLIEKYGPYEHRQWGTICGYPGLIYWT